MSSEGSFTPTFHKKPYPSISPLRSELSASGKTVLITGGSKGIGAAIAKSFAQANASNIIILGRTQSTLDATKTEIEGLGTKSKVHALVANVADAKSIDHVFATIHKDIAPINILVSNAAGASNFTTPVKDIPIEEFWSEHEINVKGALIVTQAFLKNCVKEGAVYLNISAAAAHVKYVGNWAPYTSSKMAFLKVMDHVEKENPWLRVHNIHPGVFKTDLTTDLSTEAGNVPDEFWEDIQLAGNFSVWICSPEGEFLKGRFVWSEWDVDEMKAKEKEITENPMLLNIGLNGWPFKSEREDRD